MIGVRFSIYPMRDDFVPLILGAVKDLDHLGVQVEVDDVSTCLIVEEPNLFEALRVPRAYQGPSGGEEGWSREAYDLPLYVAAQFALYPLGSTEYMDAIYGEIERARQAGAVRVVGRQFCTHLYGPCGAVFDVMRRAFAETRERATHSVMTLTVSANSPSLAEQPHPEAKPKDLRTRP